MDFSTADFSRSQGHELLTSVLKPRPVAWISTAERNGAGNHNLAPFSSIAPVCNQPPLLSFCCNRRMDGTEKNTARNIKQSGEFVVNTISPAFLERMCSSAEEFETSVDKFDHVGLIPGQCKVVKAPRVTEALASLECVLFKRIEVGEGDSRTDLFIGHIVYVHLSDTRDVGGRSVHQGDVSLLAALDLDWYLVEGRTLYRPQVSGRFEER